MKLILKIDSVNTIKNTKESISYYLIGKENLGLKITKEKGAKKIDEIEIKNISKNEKDIKKIIDNLVSSNNNLEQLGYIIEDIKDGMKNKVA